jgi:hypothetical protein
LVGLGAFPQSHASFDEPALLRRPELLNQRVDARLALIAVVAIDRHIISSRTDSPLLVVRVLSSAADWSRAGPKTAWADSATKRILVTMSGGYHPDGTLPG